MAFEGLLNNPLLALGSGLLSAGGPSLDPSQVGLGQGLSAGMNNILRQRQGQQQEQIQALKLQQLQAQMQEAQRKRAQEQRQQQAARGLLDLLPPEQRALGEGLLGSGQLDELTGLLTGGGGEQFEIVTNPEGRPIAQRSTTTGKMIAIPGVPLTKEDRLQIAAEGKASQTVNVGTSKPVGKDASAFVLPNGEIPSPTDTVEQIVDKGGVVRRTGDVRAETITAEREAKRKLFAKNVAAAEKDFTAARASFNANPRSEQRRKLESAAFALKVARAQLGNLEGEASDFSAKGQSVPGPVGVLGDTISDSLLDIIMGGGDPVEPTAPPTVDFNDLVNPQAPRAPQAPPARTGLL